MPRFDQPPIFEALVSRISDAQNVERIINDVRATYDLDHVTYHLTQTLADGVDSPYVRTTYPLEWIGEYVLRRYVDKDPVIRAGISRTASFDWDSLAGDAFYDEVMDAAEAFGIQRSGYSVPIIDKHRRRAVISFNSRRRHDEWRDYLALHAKDWIELAHHIHRKAVMEVYGQNDPLPQLGPRELECLTWSARGREAKEIAIILQLSDHTVRTYLKSARFKLGCGTLSQAVGQAMKYHLISP